MQEVLQKGGGHLTLTSPFILQYQIRTYHFNMKLGRAIAILFVAITAIACAKPLRNYDERRLDETIRMDERDFEFLGGEYDADDKKCKFTFQPKKKKKKTITLDTKIEEKGDRVICRLKGGKAEDNEDFGVRLDVFAEFKENLDWTDKNGNDVKTTKAEVEWFKQESDGKKKIKLSIFKEEAPTCKNERLNRFYYSCDKKSEKLKINRPTDGSTYFEGTYSRKCSRFSPEPVYWIAATDEDTCDRDKVCDCKVSGKEDSGKEVTCTVLVSKKTSDCQYDYVFFGFHVMCC